MRLTVFLSIVTSGRYHSFGSGQHLTTARSRLASIGISLDDKDLSVIFNDTLSSSCALVDGRVTSSASMRRTSGSRPFPGSSAPLVHSGVLGDSSAGQRRIVPILEGSAVSSEDRRRNITSTSCIVQPRWTAQENKGPSSRPSTCQSPAHQRLLTSSDTTSFPVLAAMDLLSRLRRVQPALPP